MIEEPSAPLPRRWVWVTLMVFASAAARILVLTIGRADPTSLAPPSVNVECVPARTGIGATGRYGEQRDGDHSHQGLLPHEATDGAGDQDSACHEPLQGMHGHFPKTPEDFTRDIIEFNQIELPELPAGHRYLYDAQSGELQVERPIE